MEKAYQDSPQGWGHFHFSFESFSIAYIFNNEYIKQQTTATSFLKMIVSPRNTYNS